MPVSSICYTLQPELRHLAHGGRQAMISEVNERPAQRAALRTGLLVTALLGLTGPTLAQGLDSMLGTLHATAQPIFRDGRLGGCTVVYGALARDFTYKQGGYITVNGNFGLTACA